MRVYLSGKLVVKVRTVSTFKTENTLTKKQYSAHQSLRTLERKQKIFSILYQKRRKTTFKMQICIHACLTAHRQHT